MTTETSSQYQPLGNGTSGTIRAQYLPSREGHISQNIAEAQLTLPVSRDDDAEMPAAPVAHDIATPRRHTGPQVASQHTTDDRQTKLRLLRHLWLAVCTWRSTAATVVKPQLSTSQRAYVHARCANGGAHDHELHPKQPTDQDAVEAVARQRDCVTQTAADSEILLSLTAGSDAAPQLHLQTMNRACLDAKKPSDWTKKS